MELKGKDYYQKMRYMNLWMTEERRNKQDLIDVFKMYKRFTKMDTCELFTKDLNFNGTRGQPLKLEKPECIRDARKFFFSYRVTGCWNSLDQEMVDASSINE